MSENNPFAPASHAGGHRTLFQLAFLDKKCGRVALGA